MWKLKLDESGNAVLKDGKPVYVNDGGEEKAFCANTSFSKIAQLNSEAKAHREAKEAAEEKLKAFEGIDVEKAKEAIQLIGDKDISSMIDKGEIDKVKAEMAKTYQAQIDEANKTAETLQQQLYDEKIGGSFARSQFIAEKLAIPADIAQAYFGKHFEVKDGQIVAKDGAGNEIYSHDPELIGRPAGFEEALSILVESYPNKDNILKSSGMSGSGEQGSQGGGNHTNLKRSKMSAEEKHNYVKEHGQEAFLKLEK